MQGMYRSVSVDRAWTCLARADLVNRRFDFGILEDGQVGDGEVTDSDAPATRRL